MLGKNQLIGKIGDPPPTEFQIFKRGLNTSIDGLELTYDDSSKESIMSVWKSHGTDLHIDLEHSSQEDAADGDIATHGAPATGWFDIEDRPDGLWAVNVRWLEPAVSYITAGKYRYFSPVLGADDSGKITYLKSIGLTNVPRLDNLQPLMAAKEPTMASETKPAETELKDKGLESHLKEHGEMMKADGMERKEMHGESMKAMKELADCMKDLAKPEPKQEKAKAEDDDSDESEEENKMTLETCKGALDAAIGKGITAHEAKEFSMKLDKKEITPDYVMGYLSTVKAPEVAKAPAAAAPMAFKDSDFATRKAPEWFKNGKTISDAAAAEAHLVAVCKASGIDAEKIKATWAKNEERLAVFKSSGLDK